MESEYNWYVVVTRPRWEKKIASYMKEKGVEHYCPLNKIQRQWKDRKKVILEPLFKGYVFVKVADLDKWKILEMPGILNFVYREKKPAKVIDREIETIKKFLHEFQTVEIFDHSLHKNQEVLISAGLLMDYKGIVVEVIGNKVKVDIKSIDIQLSATFDKQDLVPIA